MRTSDADLFSLTINDDFNMATEDDRLDREQQLVDKVRALGKLRELAALKLTLNGAAPLLPGLAVSTATGELVLAASTAVDPPPPHDAASSRPNSITASSPFIPLRSSQTLYMSYTSTTMEVVPELPLSSVTLSQMR